MKIRIENKSRNEKFYTQRASCLVLHQASPSKVKLSLPRAINSSHTLDWRMKKNCKDEKYPSDRAICEVQLQASLLKVKIKLRRAWKSFHSHEAIIKNDWNKNFTLREPDAWCNIRPHSQKKCFHNEYLETKSNHRLEIFMKQWLIKSFHIQGIM